MKNKNQLILAIIFILLVAAASFPYWQHHLFPKKSTFPPEIKTDSFNKDNLQSITIKTANTELKIEKKDSTWTVNNYPVDQNTLQNFFNALSSLKPGSLVSKNPENHQEFSVDEKNGTLLTLKNPSKEKTIIIGNYSSDLNSFYCRAKDSPNVYQLSGDLKTKTPTTLFDWRDKQIINLSSADISKIEITGKFNFSLQKNSEGKWEISSQKKTKILEDSDINNSVSNFNPLETDDFLNDQQKQEFTKLSSAKQASQITFFNKEGNILAQLTVIEKDGDYWVKEKNKDEIFKIYSYKLSPLFNLKEKI